MPSTVAIIQIDDSSDKTIHGVWEFDKSMGGTFVPPYVTGALPATGITNEVIFSGSKIYRWSGTQWVTATGAADVEAAYLVLTASVNPEARVFTTLDGLSGSDGGAGSTYTLGLDFRQSQFINEAGPFELMAPSESMYKVTENSMFPLTVSWYSDSGYTKLVQRKTLVRNAQQNPTTINWELYAADGVSLTRKYQETITYSGVIETSRVRNRIL